MRTLNAAGDTTVGGVIQYQDANGFAVQEILTTANATLTARGNITADATNGNPGTVKADLFTVKTLLDAGAGVALDNANDVNTLNIKVRNADDSAIAGETTTPTGTIRFKDSDGFVISGIETGGSTVLTAGDAVTQTGAVDSVKLGLSGSGNYTLNAASSGTPVNKVSVFASEATGNVNFTTQLALTIGAVNPTGITTNGAAVTISAPSIDSSAVTIDTKSSQAGTAGGAVALTTTGSGAAGNLILGNIITSGTDAVISGNGGGAAGNVTLTASGEALTVGGTITARGGAGAGAGIDGADGVVKLLATTGAVTQTDGSTEIDAGKVIVDALNSSSLFDTGNKADMIAARISGVAQSFTYRSGMDFSVGGGEGGVTGITTQGGAVDIGASDVAVTVAEAIVTKGGAFSAQGVRSFNSAGVTISTAGNIGFAEGVYKNGAAINITTTANSGAITTGTLVSSGDISASEAIGGAITLNADGALTIGPTTAQGAGTGSGGVVSLTGATVALGGNVDTSSSAGAGGDISVTGPVTLSGGNRTLTTGVGTGNVSFSSTINSDGSARDLIIYAGAGDVTLSGALGNINPLGAVTIGSAKDVVVDSTVHAAALTQQAGSGTTTLNDVVTLSGNLDFTGTNLTVNAAVNAGGTIEISNAGLFSTVSNGDISAVGGFTQNGAGSNEIAGDINTTNTNISFATPVLLTGDVAMSTDTGAGNIVFADTLDSDATTARDLTLSSGTGNVTFTGVVGGAQVLDVLTVNSGGLTKFSAPVTAASVTTDAPGTVQVNGGTVTTTGAQTYNDALTLGDNTTLTGGTITTNGTVAGGSHSLQVVGNAVFGDETADTVTGLTTLEVTDATTINTNTITSADAQTYTGTVTLGTTTTLTATNDPILFSSTVNSQSSETNVLTVTTGSGDVTFTGAVGGAVNGALGALSINSTGATKLNAAVTAASITTNAGGTTQLNGNITTSGTQTYNDNVEIQSDITLATTDSAVNFAGAVDSEATEANDLTVTTGSGNVTFTGVVGGVDALDALTVNSGGLTKFSAAVTAANVTTDAPGTVQVNGGTVTTTGAQTYNDALSLGDDTTLSGSAITTNGTVAGGSHSLDITGDAVFGDASGDTVTGLTTLSVSGTTGINTSNITSSGAQTYNDDVIVGADTTLTTTDSAVNFAGAVDSEATEANDLTVTTGNGNVTFTGVVGGVDALDALTVNSGGLTKFSAAVTAANVTTDAPGTVQVNGGTVTTTGAQTYNDALSLGDDTTLSGSAITTNGTVAGGSHSLDITGDAVFGDASGDTVTGLTTLSVSGTTGINTSNITSSGAQTYNDDVIVGADTTLTTTDSAVNFAGAVNSEATEANDLTVTTGSGNVTFTGVVGGVDALDALTVNSGGLTKFSAAVTAANVTTDAPGTVQVNGGTVTTTGAQTYNDALSLGDDTTLSGSAITTNGTVAGGGHSLDITGDAVFGDAAGDTVTGLTTLSVSGTTGINTSNITSSGAQTYNDDVIWALIRH